MYYIIFIFHVFQAESLGGLSHLLQDLRLQHGLRQGQVECTSSQRWSASEPRVIEAKNHWKSPRNAMDSRLYDLANEFFLFGHQVTCKVRAGHAVENYREAHGQSLTKSTKICKVEEWSSAILPLLSPFRGARWQSFVRKRVFLFMLYFLYWLSFTLRFCMSRGPKIDCFHRRAAPSAKVADNLPELWNDWGSSSKGEAEQKKDNSSEVHWWPTSIHGIGNAMTQNFGCSWRKLKRRYHCETMAAVLSVELRETGGSLSFSSWSQIWHSKTFCKSLKVKSFKICKSFHCFAFVCLVRLVFLWDFKLLGSYWIRCFHRFFGRLFACPKPKPKDKHLSERTFWTNRTFGKLYFYV